MGKCEGGGGGPLDPDLTLRVYPRIKTVSPFSLQAGVVSATDVDKIMSDGLGMRYAFIGPFQVAHLTAPKGNRIVISM